MQKRLVRRCEEVVSLLESNVVGSTLCGESSVLVVVLDIDEVNLHLLLCSDTDDKGRTLAGGNDLMRVVDGLDEKTESTLELLDNSLDQRGKAEIGVLRVDVLGELCDSFSVGLSLEFVTLALKQSLQLLVVCDNTVVDN